MLSWTAQLDLFYKADSVFELRDVGRMRQTAIIASHLIWAQQF